MKHLVNIDTWKRKDNFIFFRKFINPCITITSEVKCGGAKTRAKAQKQSFFLHYLYAILRAANEIEEFRYRVHRDREEVFYFDTVDILTPIRVNDDGKFVSLRIPWNENFDQFYKTAKDLISNISEDINPYDYAEDQQRAGNDDRNYDIILLSATPDLYFTGITHTVEHNNGSDFPLMNAGKVVMREGYEVMPVAIYVNHSFIDGKHVSDFFRRVEELLA